MNHFFTRISFSTLLFLGAAFLFSSCHKKAEETATPAAETGIMTFHLHNYIGDNEVENYGQVWQTPEGRQISLSLGELYLSHIELIRLDGSAYSIPDSIVLKVQENETYDIADVPVGNYKTVRFHVGLDPSTNSKPATFYSNGLLNKPEMWFGSSPQPDGYVFLNVQGHIDTTAAMNMAEGALVPFSYKIGTNAHYTLVTMPDKNFSVTKNAGGLVHMYVDYSQLFHSIDLTNQSDLSVSSAADNSSSTATKIVTAIPSMFIYEQ